MTSMPQSDTAGGDATADNVVVLGVDTHKEVHVAAGCVRMSQRGSQSERDFLTKIAVGSSIVITWFLVTLAAELLGNQANETDLGQNVGRSLLVAGIVVVPLTALVWAGIKLWRWRHPSHRSRRTRSGRPSRNPRGWRPPGPIYARDDEVAEAVQTLLDTGVAVVYGTRDVGTSAVAEAAGSG